MAGWKKPEEPPKNIPSIKVRQQWTTKCGETCGGQEEARQKIYPPCGPSPPSSGPLDLTCGMRDCMELDPCSCRCHCALRELMRAGLDPVATATQDSLVTEVPLAHMARIHTLEPRGPSLDYRRWPRDQIWREKKRQFCCRAPRYVHHVLENMLGPPPCPCGQQLVYYVKPNGVRDFWC